MEGILFAVALLPVLVLSATKRGVFSVSFLMSFHLFLGFGVRSVYLMTPQGARDILAPWLLKSENLPSLELSLLIAVFSGTVVLGLLKRSSGYHVAPRLLHVHVAKGSFSRVLSMACASLVLFLVLASIFFGGLESYAKILATRASEAVAGFAYAGILFDLFIVAVVALYYIHLRSIPSPGRALIVRTMVAAAAILLFVAGGRGNLIQYFLSLLIVRFSMRPAQLMRKYVLLASLPVLASAVIVVGLSVRVAAQYNVSYSEAQSKTIDNMTSVILAPFALTDHLMISKEFVAVRGNDFGRQYLTNVVKPIPRSIWSGKPVPLPIQVRRTFWGDDFGGIPPGFFGEAYIAFGQVGVAIAAFFLGLLALSGDKLQASGSKDSSLRLFYALIAPYLAFNLIRGGIDIAFTRVAIVIACFLLVRVVVKKTLVLGSDRPARRLR